MIVYTVMAVVGIGGGFAGLWWGWSTGTRRERFEARMRRLAEEAFRLSDTFGKMGLSAADTDAAFAQLRSLFMRVNNMVEPGIRIKIE